MTSVTCSDFFEHPLQKLYSLIRLDYALKLKEHTYFIEAVHTFYTPPFSMIRETSIFYLILLLVSYCTYGYVVSNIYGNYLSCFLSHLIWVVRLYNVLTLYVLGKIRHYFLWNLLMYFLLMYFDCHISCLNILQIFLLLLEPRVRLYIYIYILLYPSDESFIIGLCYLSHATNLLYGHCSCRGLHTTWRYLQ